MAGKADTPTNGGLLGRPGSSFFGAQIQGFSSSNDRSIRQTTEKSGAIWRGKLNCFIEMGPETLKEALRPSSGAPLRHRHRRRSHRQRHRRERT